MAEAVISADGLRKEYGSVVAVDGVSFDIRAEEIFALVGPNGAGKTTAVEMLECLRTPTGGSAEVLGFDVVEQPQEVKAHIGVVPQSFETFGRLTVRENIALVRGLYDGGRDVEEVIDQLGLAEYADTQFGSLSGGYQRRTGIAMALVSDPEVLFLDEPTTGLDPSARRTTWEQIERLTDLGTTVVLTTHYMEEVEELADRAALLVDGRLEAVDTVSNLIDTYGGEVKLVVQTEGDKADDIEATLRETATEVLYTDAGNLVGLFDDQGRAQDAFSRLHGRDDGLSIELTSAGMEEVFLRLAGGAVDSQGELL